MVDLLPKYPYSYFLQALEFYLSVFPVSILKASITFTHVKQNVIFTSMCFFLILI